MTWVTTHKAGQPETPDEYAAIFEEMTLGELAIVLSLAGVASDDDEFQEVLMKTADRLGEVSKNPELLVELYPEMFDRDHPNP